MMTKKIAVILSGCGVYDGTEINEAVLTILALEQRGFEYRFYAPDINCHDVINHADGTVLEEKRNTLKESARLARGLIHNIEDLNVDDYAGMIVPGGFGVAKNLSDYAWSSSEMTVIPPLVKVCQHFYQQDKPMGFMCIAAIIPAKVFGGGVMVTAGNEIKVSKAINALGAVHVNAAADEIVYDAQYKIVTTPAYMRAINISEVNDGINKLVDKISLLIPY